MVQIVEQRPYIENFIDFVGSFCITEKVTLDCLRRVRSTLRQIPHLNNNLAIHGGVVDEMLLVEDNLDILKKRITELKETTIIGGHPECLTAKTSIE